MASVAVGAQTHAKRFIVRGGVCVCARQSNRVCSHQTNGRMPRTTKKKNLKYLRCPVEPIHDHYFTIHLKRRIAIEYDGICIRSSPE